MLLKFASQEFMLGHYYEVTLFITLSVSNALVFAKPIGFGAFFYWPFFLFCIYSHRFSDEFLGC